MAACAFLLLYYCLIRSASFDNFIPARFPLDPARLLYRRVASNVAALFALGLFPAIFGCLFWNERPSDWGLSLGRNAKNQTVLSLILLALLLPLALYAARLPVFGARGPDIWLAVKYPKALLLYEAGVFAFLLGWEFFFRGFLLFGLKRTTGNAAIYILAIPAIAFGLMRSSPAALVALPTAVFLGHLAILTDSIWYGFFLHWLCCLALDMAFIYHYHPFA